MAPWVLLINATKIVGAAGVLTVAANTIGYLQFRRKKLAPFECPIDESQELLASFPIDKPAEDGGFFFALATAPAHVEDNLNDAWLEFARETVPDKQEQEFIQEREMDRDDARKDENTFRQASDELLASKSKSATAGELTEWEVVDEKEKAERSKSPKSDQISEEQVLDSSLIRKESATPPALLRAKSTTEEPRLQFNYPKKGRKLARVAMEAMIRGIERFAEDEEPEDAKLNVAAWHNVVHPEERVRFWSDPDTELRLSQKTNVTVFRMGVDWTRIVPLEPKDISFEQAVNWSAVKRYKHIIERVRAHGMRVMLTLFHHSLPPWAASYGGWKEERTVKYFLDFTRLVVEEYGEMVDFWVTINEPHVFAMLTYCAGAWPGGHPDLLETATAVMPRGVFNRVMDLMADAHNQAYDIIHEISRRRSQTTQVGISHHVSFVRPYGLFDVSAAVISNWKTHFPYVDAVCKKLDYLGLNYYGQEFISAPGLKLVENEEYSESARAIYPDGLYRVLLAFHDRYKSCGFPFIITENGVSDCTDLIRRPYIIEHLLAIRAAMNKGVPIRGYCFWTVSDNWEWADGYGPKFGLAAVDRRNNLARCPRPSYYLFAELARTGKVTRKQRATAWKELQDAAAKGTKRPFYRAVDANGLMYAGGLDVPIERPFVQRDWRFGHYEVDGLQDPLNRALRAVIRVLLFRRSKPGKKPSLDSDQVEKVDTMNQQEEEEVREEAPQEEVPLAV
ncbi:galactolipid galactosyltransferase SFR2, chloroplastic [Selaginella moellendorffii]|uniref:galactolipid galactosyltransferase SFR2, chloroplastic n=1 Tax=Selaginella moellendorffii TaxID=88036 RepID=UPI000D1C257E|nr:galactolipid galactosyltransferase SFR2, chloroplastic [Selaginella moellendorffii]|eukprot:XP_024518202.1 galactolipid galactosyltransferase SFR2, chloroplastic [Selaginella moellendorffii]